MHANWNQSGQTYVQFLARPRILAEV